MDAEMFAKRLTDLRIEKGVSARDMSLSLGQSPGYINNIENGSNLPSMNSFFAICDYFQLTPAQFFDIETRSPQKTQELLSAVRRLSPEVINKLTAIAHELK